MNVFRLTVVVLAMLASSLSASAQGGDVGSAVPDLLKQVLFDPTTYVPTIVAWKTTRLDWQSSQAFFQSGWTEHNSRFTVSGRSDDVAVGYAAGNRQILMDAVTDFQLSLVNNLSARVVERVLLPRYPNHRGLIRALGWVERSAMASYLTYRLSADHYHQWQTNERNAQQLGLN